MNFFEAIQSGFSNYFKFSGRSLRSEYWYFVLFLVVVLFLLTFLDAEISNYPSWIDFVSSEEIGVTGTIFNAGTLTPYLAVTVRRLHDTNRVGWWMLIPFTIIGIIPFLYWMCKEGDNGTNKHGETPAGSGGVDIHTNIMTSNESSESSIKPDSQELLSSAVPDIDVAQNTLKEELEKIEELFTNSLITEEEKQRMRDKALGINSS